MSTPSSPTGSRPRWCSVLPRAEIADCDRAAAIVLLGPDLKEELPGPAPARAQSGGRARCPGHRLLDGRLRVEPLAIDLHVAPGEAGVAAERLGDARWPATLDRERRRDRPCRRVLRDRERPDRRRARPRVARRTRRRTLRAAAALAGCPTSASSRRCGAATCTARSSSVSRPECLPGRVSLDAGRDVFTAAVGRRSRGTGSRRDGHPARRRRRHVHVLVLLGATRCADFPDRALARGARRAGDGHRGRRVPLRVDARTPMSFFPRTLWGEKHGHGHEPRRPGPAARPQGLPAGTAMDDWRIAIRARAAAWDPTSISSTSTRSPTRSPGSRPCSRRDRRAAAPSPRRPRAARLASTAPRSCCARVSSRSSPTTAPAPLGADPGRGRGGPTRTRRRAAGARSKRPRTPSRCSSGIGRVRIHGRARARRVRSAPRDRPHALRRRSCRRVVAVDRGPRRERRVARAARPTSAASASTEGAEVQGHLGAGSLAAPGARRSARLPVGVARLDFTADAPGAADLIDATAIVTDVRVETLR